MDSDIGELNDDAINFNPNGTGDVSREWGYDNQDLNSGPFQNVSAGGEAYSTVNTTVSVLQSSSKDGIFAGNGNNNNLGGPDFGLLSDSVASSVAGGLEAIQSSVIITLTWGGGDGLPGFAADWINIIQAGNVVLAFGSPNASRMVPEPATLLLLGAGLIGLAGLRRKFRKS